MMDDREFRALYRQTFAQVRCPARAAQAAAAARPHRRPGWRLAVCLAAPLLLAAGVLAGEATFTNLREDPRPSFAPQANTGYAVSLPYRTFPADTLGKELRGDLATPPVLYWEDCWISFGSYDDLFSYDVGRSHIRAFDQWQEVIDYTGLPLLQSDLLDEMLPSYCASKSTTDYDESKKVVLDNGIVSRPMKKLAQYPIAVQSVEDTDSGRMEVHMIWTCRTAEDMHVQLQAQAFVSAEGEKSEESVLHKLYAQRTSLTWDVENYTLPTGDVAVLPVCTSNPMGFSSNGIAFFTHNGIQYSIRVFGSDSGIHATPAQREKLLKEILDSFSVDTAQ